MELNLEENDKILGIFAQSHMQYKLLSEGLNQPSLTEMTAKALEKLKENEKGFVLLVEGGRIDHGHHETRARLALEETVEFHKAVEYVKENTSEEDTLIVVTADHSHGFTVGGYAVRKIENLSLFVRETFNSIIPAKGQKYSWRQRLLPIR